MEPNVVRYVQLYEILLLGLQFIISSNILIVVSLAISRLPRKRKKIVLGTDSRFVFRRKEG